MTDSNSTQQRVDIGGIVVAVILILVGAIAIWDTTSMLDSDSFVFPRAVAISMICLSILFILRQLISPYRGSNDEAGIAGGSYLRRIGLVIVMVASALLMPWLGFLVSGILVFGAIMLLAMYDEWTLRLRLVFPLAGIVIVFGFYLMFAELLLVPLPEGSIFE